MKCNKKQTILISVLLLYVFILTAQADPTIHYPTDKTVCIMPDKKIWLEDGRYLQSGDSIMRITSWPDSGWWNYSTDAPVTQQFYYGGDKPTTVYIDGILREEGVGWTYAGGLLSVDSIAYANVGWVITPPEPTGTLQIYAIANDSYVVVTVNVVGPENHTGDTTTEELNPLYFVTEPGEYNVSGTYAAIYNSTVVTVTQDHIVQAILYFGESTETPPPPIDIIVPEDSTQVTWYMRSDTHTTNDILGYILDTTNTHTTATDTVVTGVNTTASYGVRVFEIMAGTALRELTANTPEAVSTRTSEGEGIETVYWNCPGSVDYGAIVEAIVVKVYQRFGSGVWNLRTTFISNDNLLIKLPEATWTIRLYTNLTGTTSSIFKYGASATDSSVTLYYQSPTLAEIQLFMFNAGDFIGFIVAPFIVHVGGLTINWLYPFFIVIIFATLYERQEDIVPIALFLLLFCGSGGVILALIPSNGVSGAYQILFLFIAFAVCLLLYRLVKGRSYGEM